MIQYLTDFLWKTLMKAKTGMFDIFLSNIFLKFEGKIYEKHNNIIFGNEIELLYLLLYFAYINTYLRV